MSWLRTRIKRAGELHYWRRRKRSEGELANSWYVDAFTKLFERDISHYAGKRMLDVGCGPRGSLEWADEAARRVGLDPLAERYLLLGADSHAMEYVAAPAEEMPFPDDSFDVVSVFNALDHVEDVGRVIGEIKRILAPGGEVLLLVEIGHEPTITEPHRLGWDLPARFEPLRVAYDARFAQSPGHSIYVDLLERRRRHEGTGPGWLVARLEA